MFYRSLFIILFFICGSASAFQFPLEIIDYMDNSRIIIYANKSDINQSPRWAITDNTPPPLTISSLISKVNKWTVQQKDLQDARVNEIELKKMQQHEKDNYWYYLVQLKSTQAAKNKNIHYIAVLMNGKILTAIKEPSSYK